jgi:hypothetical protein
MATERLSMRNAREILRQKWELGRTHREIAASVGQSLGNRPRIHVLTGSSVPG